MKELFVEAKQENLDQVLAFIMDCLETADCPPKARFQIEVSAEEIFVNIASYAYDSGMGTAVVGVDLKEDPQTVILRFSDHGRPYDPLAKPDPDIKASIEDRMPGGLGIFVTKTYMDEIHYEYKDGQNILTMKKRIG